MFAAWVNSGNTSGLLVRVVSANITEEVMVNSTDFLANYGFNVWIHLGFTYKYGSDIDLYLDGVARPNNEKFSGPGSGVDGAFGSLIVGATYIGQSNGYEAFMMLDDLIIWERWTNENTVKKLYQSY